MADLVLLKQRLVNIESVNEITEAMQIINTIMIGRSQKLMNYRKKIQPHFARLLFTIDQDIVSKHKTSKKEWIIIFFSEKGFVSSFNQQLMPYLIKHKHHQNLIIIGDKGRLFCEKLGIKYKYFFNAPKKIPHESIIEPIYDILKADGFPWNTKIIINKYSNMFKQQPGEIDFFPQFENVYKTANTNTDLDKITLYEAIISKFVRDRLYYFFIQNFTGETASKLLMMKNAVENSEKLKETLAKEIYKARQTKITQELSEVISSYKVLQSREEK